jgi:2'-5' RNA ligase
MPYAVSLCLDDAAAQRIEAMWRILDARNLSDHMRRLAYRPHVTLGLWDELDVEDAMPRLAAFAASLPPIECGFAALASFPGPDGVLWAVPVTTRALLAAHARLHAELAIPTRPHYRVGAWVPHCTLGMQLSAKKAAAALEELSAAWEPFPARLDRLDLVRFNPVEILWERKLARRAAEAHPPH